MRKSGNGLQECSVSVVVEVATVPTILLEEEKCSYSERFILFE
jgi:hypothetical protein